MRALNLGTTPGRAAARPVVPAGAARVVARSCAAPLRRAAGPLVTRPPLARRGPSPAAASADDQLVEDKSFRIEQLSFGSILTPLGVGLLAYGFGAFFQLLPGTDASPLMLIYGFPISLLGFALSYAQLRPVPCATTAGAAAVREAQATDIQKQLRDDVTRFRYGDEQHLEEALNRVFQFGRSTGIPRRLAPTLVGVREELTGPNKAYTLVLEFETKPEMTLEMWTDRQAKIEGFFGPGITASIVKTERGVDVPLAVDGSGAGRGGGPQKDVLIPLMPGMPARRQD